MIKNTLNRSLIIPVQLYGTATWMMMNRDDKALEAFEGIVLRKVIGAVREAMSILHKGTMNSMSSTPTWI